MQALKILTALIIFVVFASWGYHKIKHGSMSGTVATDPAAIKLDQDIRAGLISNPSLGSPDAKNVVVEFYDYNCHYCKDVDSNIDSLAKKDNVRVVLIDYPILGDSSYDAAKITLAVFNHYPDKYLEFHHKVMGSYKSKEQILKLAQDMGVSEKLDADTNPLYDQVIEADRNLANSLDVHGTPEFIVNGIFVGGYSSVDEYLKD